MIDRAEIVEHARSWLGTPWHHQARLKGVGADCVAVAIGTAKNFGFVPDFVDDPRYSRNPDGSMEQILEFYLCRVAWPERLPGDVVHVAWSRIPQHVGILTERDTLIHAYGHNGVVETSLTGFLKSGVRGVYRFPELMA